MLGKKKKPEEKIPERPKITEEFLEEMPDGPELCDCGKPLSPEFYPQCWDCSHRK